MSEGVLAWLDGKLAQRPHPFAVTLELTEVCNLHCRHCYLTERTNPGLPTETVKDIFDQLAAAGTLFLTLTGGEVMTRPDFLELVDDARGKGFGVRILTTGTLLTLEMADALAGLHVLGVEMSLYGADALVHEEVTGVNGSFERTLRAAHLLRERGIKVYLKTVLMRRNIHQVDQMRALAAGLGAEYAADLYLTAQRDGADGVFAERATDEQLLRFFSQAFRTTPEDELARLFSEACDLPLESAPAADRVCNAGVSGCRIGVDGRVYPCIEIDLCAGDLLVQRFDDVWRSSPVFERIRALRRGDFKTCAACKFYDACVRHCPGLGLLEEGDLYAAPREACRLTQVRYQAYKTMQAQGG